MKKYSEIENAYMEKAKQQLATAKKVEIISAIICVVFAVGGTGLCLRIGGLVGAVGAIVLVYFCAFAFWMYWQENTDISAAPYKNALNVLSCTVMRLRIMVLMPHCTEKQLPLIEKK